MAKSTGAELIWANEAEAEAMLPQLVEGDAALTALIVQNLCACRRYRYRALRARADLRAISFCLQVQMPSSSATGRR
jgi:hypothetical protein